MPPCCLRPALPRRLHKTGRLCGGRHTTLRVPVLLRRSLLRWSRLPISSSHQITRTAGINATSSRSPSAREGHGAELLGATQTAHPVIAAVTCHDPCKAGPRHKLHELREHRLAQVHSSSPKVSTSGSYSNRKMGKLISNRHQNKSLYNPRRCFISAHESVS